MDVSEWGAHEINDDYEHLDNNLEYILENVLSIDNCNDSLKDQYNSLLMNRCHCHTEDDCSDCCHGGNYIVDESSELILNPTKACELIYECSSLCSCSKEKCINRLVQNGPRKHLKIIDSPVIGSKGLITTAPIPVGGFICEYAGELLSPPEALERVAANEQAGCMNYILCLREKSIDGSGGEITIIDPSIRGNIGRYINHSCTPNCKILSVRIDCPVPKVGIFANRYIAAGEELYFHYGEGQCSPGEGDNPNAVVTQKPTDTPCLCRSVNCTGFMPNTKF